ncbi:hypothetical protein HJC99_02215 [Candidatus Saccharibacteria bacterium]|nr:hypothetical protein [Candidatus Saccharibacteria bacterium]
MAKPVIAIDIDEVLAPFNERILAHYNRIDGTSIEAHEYGGLVDFEDLWHIPRAEAIVRFEEYHRHGHSGRHEPMDESIAAVSELKQHFELVVITSRQLEFQTVTTEWVKRHYPGIFRDVHLANYWDEDRPRSTKAAICQQSHAQVLIDDDLKYVTEAAEAGLRGILFGDYSWNQAGTLPQGVTRVHNWREAVILLTEGL